MAHDNANNPVGQIIGRNIRALRDANGQSQVQFAEMIGISRPYLNQIEKGKMNWSLKMLVKIADGLDVPITLLFEGLDTCPPHKLQPGVSYSVVKFPGKKRETS